MTTPYVIFQFMQGVFRTGDRKNLFLRDVVATPGGLRRVLDNLANTHAIAPDRDDQRGVHRVVSVSENPAEDLRSRESLRLRFTPLRDAALGADEQAARGSGPHHAASQCRSAARR